MNDLLNSGLFNSMGLSISEVEYQRRLQEERKRQYLEEMARAQQEAMMARGNMLNSSTAYYTGNGVAPKKPDPEKATTKTPATRPMNKLLLLFEP